MINHSIYSQPPLVTASAENCRADELRQQASRCRRLAGSMLDRQTIDSLSAMAVECDAEADRLGKL